MDEAKLKKWVEREEEKEKPGHPTQSIMDNMTKDDIISLNNYPNSIHPDQTINMGTKYSNY